MGGRQKPCADITSTEFSAWHSDALRFAVYVSRRAQAHSIGC